MRNVDKVSVVVASLGRPQNLRALLESLGRQTLLPYRVVLSVESDADCPDFVGLKFPIEVVKGPRGMCHQRNRGLEPVLLDSGAIVFFDDDYVPSRHVISGIAEAFRTFADVGGISGVLLDDGINGPGIPETTAQAMVQTADADYRPAPPRILRTMEGLYGCNMAYRTSGIGDNRFDERLPLYAWQEDVDFSARIVGRTVQTDAFFGVHCGTKRGREKSGKRLGYSQVANNFYLVRKGTMSTRKAGMLALRNILANHAKIFRPEPWIDRRGRCAGNWMAIGDILRGKSEPERILQL